MSLIARLARLREKGSAVKFPPPRTPDPEIVSGAMEATRALTKYDAALKRRQRLNLELAHAEELIRRARDPRTSS